MSPAKSDLDVEWIDPSSVDPNEYNPNEMTKRDKKQLARSILHNGWTQPIVVNEETGQIIDGEQRWSLAADEDDRIHDDELRERDDLTPDGVPAGHVPVTRISKDEASARISTVQHNRARGEHSVEGMSDLLAEVHEFDELEFAQEQLFMSDEEVNRLLEDSPAIEFGTEDEQDDYSAMWEPEEDDDTGEDGDASATSAAAGSLERQDGAEPGDDEEELERRTFVMTQKEAALVDEVLGTDVPAQILVVLCEHAQTEGWVPSEPEENEAVADD